MKCKICNDQSILFTESKIMNKYLIKYYLCGNCEFIQTEEPFWLKESYKNPINETDTGILDRNIMLSKITTNLIAKFFDSKASFLDYAGGYGIFVRLMRDVGINFLWDDKYCNNLLANGFSFSDYEHTKIELITCFESFEHFVNPIEEINIMLDISSSILFTTVLRPELESKPDDWWYYALEHGQHIAFYRLKTLEKIAHINNLYFHSNGINIHLLTDKKIPNKNIIKQLNQKNMNKEFDKNAKQFQPKMIHDMNDILGRK